MAQPELARRVRMDAGDRRERILAAAQRLFARRAYESVSTSEIAAAAGTTRTNLHHHFGTKRALYLAVVARFAHLADLPAVYSPDGDVATDVMRTFDNWLDSIERNRETYLSMLRAGSLQHDPEIDALLRRGLRAWENRLLHILRIPPTQRNRALLRAFQALASTATDEWLRLDTLSRADVHTLLTRTLLQLKDAPDGKGQPTTQRS
jgi:AcrR family transcriptional regulator